MRTGVAVLLGLAAMVAGGCGPTPGPTPGPDATPAPADPARIRYTCGTFPFEASLLGVARSDEQADTPIAAALREHLARPEIDIDWLPDEGWTLVGANGTRAEFVTAGAADLFSVTLANEGGWRVTGWGGCQPERLLPAGLGSASWVLADPAAIGPATVVFDALVTELDCASGQSSEGRVVGPEVLALADAVLVTFAVRPPPGAGGQTCPSNPPTRVTVTLPGPLGDRRLLDGSTVPPREPLPDP